MKAPEYVSEDDREQWFEEHIKNLRDTISIISYANKQLELERDHWKSHSESLPSQLPPDEEE